METDAPRYKVAFSDMQFESKLNRDDPQSAWVMDHLMESFVNEELTQLDIVEKIAWGHPFTAWHSGRKRQENFLAAQIIPVDLDTDDARSSIETLRQDIIVRSYSFLTYATPSHMVVGPRSRVLFLLDEPITTVEGYKTAAKVLYSFFPHADGSVGEPSKFLYGMTRKDAPHWWNAKVLPLAQLRLWYEQWKRSQPVAVHRPRNVVSMDAYRNAKVNVEALLEPLRNARNGDRNNQLHRAAFIAGKDVASGRLTYDEAVALLTDAARVTGLPDHEIQRTIEKSIERGRSAA